MKHITWKSICGVVLLLLAAGVAIDAPAALSEIELRLFVLFTVTLGIICLAGSLKRTASVEAD